ncbi:MAG TPA: response regulator transcription factor [Candidatus Mediterraneibacter intestinipullorum]|nr:response regulator transcription factor [Candidatus Mediterraneibacter intestinipullorum]
MEDKRRILIAEDDAHINELLHTALSKAGYSTVQVYSGSEAKMLLGMGENKFDLILLDLMLPGMTGEELLAKVSVLTGGADDYITKPFEIPEVVARVQVQLRRTVNEQGSDRLTYHDLVLDRTTRQVAVSGTPLSKVTKQEYAILELLMRNPKQVFSKEDIFEYAWEEPYMGETKTLDVHISNIRKKLKAVTSEEYIEIVWGIGYRLHP